MSHAYFPIRIAMVSLAICAGCTRPNALFEETAAPAGGDLGVAAGPGPGVPDASVSSAPPDLAIACPAGRFDCDGDPSNGCEAATASESGEPANDSCAGPIGGDTLQSGDSTELQGRILSASDRDRFTVRLKGGLRLCVGGQIESVARVHLAAPSGAGLLLRGSISDSACSESWSAWAGETLCFRWDEGCIDVGHSFADQVVTVEVGAPNGGGSCAPYQLEVQLCAPGDACPGC